jgi:DNA-binding response OmpR family regulator
MARILVVEDQVKLLRTLEQGLREEGHEVLTADNAETGYYLAATKSVDAVILDWMLPGRSGVDVLRELRATGFAMPVLMLTARDQVRDRVTGLDAGADDYLVKPFDFEELLARLRALLRRKNNPREFMLRADDLELDLLTRRVLRGGEEIELSRREFELLEFLLRRRNRTVPRDELARELWKEPAILTNVIDVTVKQLRKKIERPGSRQLIATIRGVGYSLRDDFGEPT